MGVGIRAFFRTADNNGLLIAHHFFKISGMKLPF